ncbi:hypothetical protein EB083_05990 [bacterium]|nr:hypothetical protein [bacterium]
MLGDLANWVQDVINQFGYFGVALLVVIENVFPPIPSEIVLPFAGFVAWNIALIGAGAILGDQWERVGEYVGVFQWLVIAAIFVLLVRFVFSRLKNRRRQNGVTQ